MASRFGTTRWSLVRAAQGPTSLHSRAALAELCRAYRGPLLALARRHARTPEDAEDLTQAFLTAIVEKDVLSGVRPEQGRLRSYLRACLAHFAAHVRERERAEKRGGGRVVSLNALGDVSLEPRAASGLEEEFDRRWALAVVERATARLASEMIGPEARRRFEVLAPCLAGDASVSHAETAARLGCTEGAVKVALHRLRRRFGQHVRAEVAETVDGEELVEAEMRHLLDALSSRGSS